MPHEWAIVIDEASEDVTETSSNRSPLISIDGRRVRTPADNPDGNMVMARMTTAAKTSVRFRWSRISCLALSGLDILFG